MAGETLALALRVLGWGATIEMAAGVVAMAASWFG
jgi:hypothetical protein